MPLETRDAWAFCDRILVDVSRSFALIIPRCPPPLDGSLCAGYLLCRLADCIEDDERLSEPQRERLYDALLACVHAPEEEGLADRFIAAWPALPAGSYGELIRGTQEVLTALASLPPACQGPLVRCVEEMIAGMRSMKPVLTTNGLTFYCRDLAELDRYCHHVAGTVGVMSTTLFEDYLAAHPESASGFVATPQWREQGRRMGLGLQMTNIIKDAASDAARGVSYIPPKYVIHDGVRTALSPAGRAELIAHALTHLDEAMDYACALPWAQTGIRAFLFGSILPAVATLELAADGQPSPKIDRDTMGDILALIASNPDDAALQAWYRARRAGCTA